jgi:cytochrome c biogenesis protein CcmG/thiol:disulfide interchange protein DsbE
MRIKDSLKYTIPLLVFIGLAVFLWRGLSLNPHLLPSPLVGKMVPEFTLESVANSTHVITQKDLQGRVTLLNVFATWCGYCHAEHPVLMDISNTNQVSIVGLNYKDERSAVLGWLNEFGNPYREVIYDKAGTLGINLGVYGTPETFILDKKGVIRYRYVGPVTWSEWQRTLLPLIKKLKAEA